MICRMLSMSSFFEGMGHPGKPEPLGGHPTASTRQVATEERRAQQWAVWMKEGVGTDHPPASVPHSVARPKHPVKRDAGVDKPNVGKELRAG